jgi:hypothetical protein
MRIEEGGHVNQETISINRHDMRWFGHGPGSHSVVYCAPMATRLYAYLVSAVVLAAVCYPFAWPLHRDSFPLSPYPMFSRKLPEPTVTLQYAVGVAPDGTRHHLKPSLVANQEVLQARAVLGRAVSMGQEATRALCRTIAGRVARERDLAGVTEVRIVTGTHDAVAYLAGRDTRGQERVHGRCPVERVP